MPLKAVLDGAATMNDVHSLKQVFRAIVLAYVYIFISLLIVISYD